IIREVFVKHLLDSFRKLSFNYCDNVKRDRLMAFMDLIGSKRDRLINVSFMRILRLREVARMTARIALEFAPDMSPPIRRKYHDSVAFATGCKRIKNSKRCNRKIRIPIAMWPCRVEEKMTLKEVDGQTVEEIETKIIAKDGTITRVPGKFQGYETSEEEPVEQPRRHDLYGFVDHPQLQQGNPMNEFAPHRLPQPKGNMNGWLIEDEEEVERNEVDSDLESTASSKPVWKKTTKADHDRASRFSNNDSSGGNPTPTYKPFTFEFILEEIEAFLKDDSISSEIDYTDCDLEEDICLIEKLLNNDPFQLPLMDLKQKNDKLPVIIAKGLKDDEKEALLKVLKSHKRAIAWKITDIKGIDPHFCTHKILMEDDYKPTVQSQRRVNPKIHEVIKKEVLKLLDASMIYPISDSPWVSPVHCVPKKGGITVVANEENELIPTRLVTGWRVCIDYRKLNEATRKDHFPLPFMDQMLERLAGNEFYCFLDGFLGYFQIPIDPQDQEKTTFTCPYGTFAYRHMLFGLCNAPSTFQRCMMDIFHDMIEKTMEVFMDDFSVFGDSFDSCLSNLEKMLKRCEDTNLVLNWEKCHFMCREGIVLGHKISKSGIEVDRAKVDVIAKLPHPTTYKTRCSTTINRGLIQAILISLPPQPIGEATKASNLRRIPPGVQGRSHFT
ncbi:reverse transcriptase domain-containing protein, partial [Tanacetum coccineum]